MAPSAGRLVITAVSALYVWYNYRALPQASLDLRYSREQITEKAQAFLNGRGLRTDGFRNLTLFDPDDASRLFLEREVGLERANRLMQSDVAIWRWRARWYNLPRKKKCASGSRRTGGWLASSMWFRKPRRVRDRTARLLTLAPRSSCDRRRRSRTGWWKRISNSGRTSRLRVHMGARRVQHTGRHLPPHRRDAGRPRRLLHRVPPRPRTMETRFRRTALEDLSIRRSRGVYIPLIVAAIMVHIQAIQRRQCRGVR